MVSVFERVVAVQDDSSAINFFQRYLTVWVLLCMAAGVGLGLAVPAAPAALARMTAAGISIPIAVLIWVMIFPMMMHVDFASVREVARNPKGLFVTWGVNWLVKPFSMYLFASFFLFSVFDGWIDPALGRSYLAGAVLLGAAPCTAMVFVWSALTRGNPAYTVMQVATNDLIILVAFVPIVKFLLGVSDISVPYATLFLSVFLFVVVPIALGALTRRAVVARRGRDYFEQRFLRSFDSVTTAGLLLTLVLIFSSQAQIIAENPLHIVWIAIPLVLQTAFVFLLAFGICRALALPFDVAAPAGMIGASNFFELAVAVAVALFGAGSGAALATTVGVLTEVPVMLALVRFANAMRSRWPRP